MECLRWPCEGGGKYIWNGVFDGEYRDDLVVEQICGLAQELGCNICHGWVEVGLGQEGGWWAEDNNAQMVRQGGCQVCNHMVMMVIEEKNK